ncbi:hypothetical protein PC119_g21620 [Phytophthora cactorum]|nr:hypothetical protein PC114_g17766 [Phytophthora cactorum]KAG2978966.1 hypothetical protein PC119_g21620 [Phytophthora cactorum]
MTLPATSWRAVPEPLAFSFSEHGSAFADRVEFVTSTNTTMFTAEGHATSMWLWPGTKHSRQQTAHHVRVVKQYPCQEIAQPLQVCRR